MSGIAGAVLAAGFSTRFHGDKLSQLIGGRPLLLWTLESLKPVKHKAVVLRFNDPKKKIITTDYTILVNIRASHGLSSSIRVAASWTPPDAQGLLLVLGDQPLSWMITPRIVEEFEKGGCLGVSALFNDEPVSPAVFSREIIHELLLLDGDVGAKSVILRHRGLFRFVDTPYEAIMDCDTLESLEDIVRVLDLIHGL